MTERSMILVNFLGDVEIAWEQQNDLEMRKFIQQQMDKGVRFFVIKPLIGQLLPRKTALKHIKDLDRHVVVKDPDVAALVAAKAATIHRADNGLVTDKNSVLEPSKNIDQIVQGRSMAMRPLVGG